MTRYVEGADGKLISFEEIEERYRIAWAFADKKFRELIGREMYALPFRAQDDPPPPPPLPKPIDLPNFSSFNGEDRVSLYNDGTVEIQAGAKSFRATFGQWVAAAERINRL